MKQVENKKDLYIEYLNDIYSAEVHSVVAFHFFENSATEEKLKKLIHIYTGETRLQVLRMEEIIEHYQDGPILEHYRSMREMIEESKELVKRCTPGDLRDYAIINSTKRIIRCKIVVYHLLLDMAETLASAEENELLEQNLRQENEFYASIDDMIKPVAD